MTYFIRMMINDYYDDCELVGNVFKYVTWTEARKRLLGDIGKPAKSLKMFLGLNY